METTIKEGDILAGTWGYSMTIPCFYLVVKVTEKRLKVVEIEKRMVRSTDGGYFQQGYEAPVEPYQPRRGEKEELARPGKGEFGYWYVGSKWDTRLLEKWNGKPVWADYMD